MASSDARNDASSDELLGQLTADFLDRAERGDNPQIEEYAQRHPEIAELIRDVFPLLDLIKLSASESATPFSQASKTFAIHRQLGDFRINRELGRGGMGVVYEAQQLSIARKVALKVFPFATLLDPTRLKRFKNEVQAAAALDHPNIVSVYSVGEERGIHYYAMQLIRGPNLAEVIENLRSLKSKDAGFGATSIHEAVVAPEALPPKDADYEPTSNLHQQSTTSLQADQETVSKAALSSIAKNTPREYYLSVAALGIQLAEALAYAHDHGILHRDIKPANLLLDENCKPFITDFGVAQIESETHLTMTGDILGTLRYMSPEQASGQRVLDPRSDVYSLGVTLYELLTLQPAFPESDRKRLISQVIHSEPLAPCKIDRMIPRDLESIVLKAVAQLPADRYASAQRLADDLRRFSDGKPTFAKPLNFYSKTLKWSARNPAVVVATFTVMLVIMFATAASNHVLRQEWLRAEKAEQSAKIEAFNAQRSAASTKTINRFLTDYVLAKADPRGGDTVGGHPFRDALDNASEYADRWFPQEPDLRGSLYRTIAQLYARLGEYERSANQYRSALDILRTSKSFQSDVLECMNGLGLALFELNHAEEAESWLRQSLEQARNSLGDQDPVVLTAMLGLSKVLSLQKPAEAESLARKCWGIRKEVLGKDHFDTAITAVGLADILVGLEKLPEAQELLIPAVEVLRSERGAEDLETQSGIRALARIYEQRKELNLAETLYREIFQARTRVQGTHHSLTLAAISDLANLLETQGQLAEAETLTRQILQAHQVKSGGMSSDTRATTNRLSDLLWKQGKLIDAAALFKMNTIIDPGKDQGTLEISILYCDVLLGLGKYAEAESLMRKSWAAGNKELGLNHPASRNCFSRLLLSLSCQRKIFETNKLGRQNMSQLMAGSEDNTSGQPEVLALGFIAERRPQPWTEDMLRASLRHKQATLAKSHLSTAMTLAILGQDLLSNRKPQDAESILRESLAMRHEALPKDSWLIAETESLLGECMVQLNQFEEAETFLVKSFQVVENSVDLVPAIRLEFVQRICTLYEQWGRHEQNSAWQIQLEKLLRACLFDWKDSAAANEQLVMATEVRLGECIGTLGRYEEAEEMLLRTYALLCFNSGWSSDPYSVGKAASKLDECRRSLNRLYQQWKQPDELSRWQKLVSLLPSQGENASVECHLQGIAIWKQVCNRYPNSLFQVRLARAHSDLGLAYFRTEQFQESLLCFQKSIDQLEVVLAGDPQNEWALEHLGATQASMGDTLSDLQRNSEALATYEKAAAIAKRLTTGGSDNLPGTTLEAKRVPIKLAMFLANCPDATYRDPGRAIKTVQEAEDLKADQGMLLARGLALYHSGDWQAVIESHKQMLPGRPEALVVAMSHERLGDHEKARFYYDTSVARYQNALILSGWRESRERKQLFRQASEVLGIGVDHRDAIAAHWNRVSVGRIAI